MIVRTTNKNLFGQSTATIAGYATFDAQGNADVDVAIVASLLDAPGFEADPEVVELIADFRGRSESEARAAAFYDTGPAVTITIPTSKEDPRPRFRNEKVRASDNELVVFDAVGVGHCGLNTALAMQAVYPDARIELVERPQVQEPIVQVEAPTPPPPPLSEFGPEPMAPPEPEPDTQPRKSNNKKGK